MTLGTRRQFVSCAPAILIGSATLSACSWGTDDVDYEAAATRTWRLGALAGF